MTPGRSGSAAAIFSAANTAPAQLQPPAAMARAIGRAWTAGSSARSAISASSSAAASMRQSASSASVCGLARPNASATPAGVGRQKAPGAGEGVEVQNIAPRKAPDPEPPRNPGAIAMKRGFALGHSRQPVGKRGKGQIRVRAIGPAPQGLARSDDQHGSRGHSLQVVRRSPFSRKPVILDHARLCRFRTVNGHSGFASIRSSAISAVIPTEASGSRPFDGLRTGSFDTPRISSGATQDEGWVGKVTNISLIPSRPAGPYRGTERTSGARPCGRMSQNRARRGSRVDHLCGAA